MKLKHYLWITIWLITALTIVLPGMTQQATSSNTLFQTSAINALLAGVYDGDTTFQELKQQGDFGLGTVNALDGEMIGLEGKFYQIKSDGIAYSIPESMKTPLAAVTFFKSDKLINLEGTMNYQKIQQLIDQKLPTKNYPYAIRIQGTFPYLKFRSVPKQKPPYRPLVDVVKDQSIFELRNVKGTLVGFRTPHYMQGVNISGYHLHFITQDRKTGGHLLDGQFQDAKVELDAMSDVKIVLPKNGEFEKADLGDDRTAQVNQVER